jgi:hypothetical protein
MTNSIYQKTTDLPMYIYYTIYDRKNLKLILFISTDWKIIDKIEFNSISYIECVNPTLVNTNLSTFEDIYSFEIQDNKLLLYAQNQDDPYTPTTTITADNIEVHEIGKLQNSDITLNNLIEFVNIGA